MRALVLAAFSILALLALSAVPASAAAGGSSHTTGLRTIAADDVEMHVWSLAAPELEGRDTPSAGLDRAAEYVARAFREAGLEPWTALPGSADARGRSPRADGRTAASEPWREYLWSWTRQMEGPDLEGSALALETDGEEPVRFEAGADFVPVLEFAGEAAGELAFLGFGIRSKKERFDEWKGVELRGKVALIVMGEPRHSKRFEGHEAVTPDASFWSKVGALANERVAGVLVVRRPPEESRRMPVDVAPAPFAYRWSWAVWQGRDNDAIPPVRERLPVLEITPATASRLLGDDVLKMAERIDRTGRPQSDALRGRRVRFTSQTSWRETAVDNVCGFVRGTDPELAGELVVVGAHHDHVGVDPRGRIAAGADDNASGTAVVLELAQAFAAAPPRRSVLLITFSGEEDGLLGSRAFCERLPVPPSSLVAMVNLDMVGRGERDELAAIGCVQNPDLEKVLERARKLSRTGVSEIDFPRGDPDGLFKRSDHYPFHRIGVPAVFLFEGLPIRRNEDYHTWRDTPDRVDPEKIARTARLAYNTAWLLATDDERPAKPRR